MITVNCQYPELNTCPNAKTQNTSSSNTKDFANILNELTNDAGLSSMADSGDIYSKAQKRFELDMSNLARRMGIGPKMLMAVIGDLKIDPTYYDFQVKTDADRAVKELADYLGISPMTMMAIFDKLGIQSSDLQDKSKTSKILSKLVDFLKLNDDQEKDVRDILKKYVTTK